MGWWSGDKTYLRLSFSSNFYRFVRAAIESFWDSSLTKTIKSSTFVNRIKGFFKSRKIGFQVERMIKQHRKFFDTEIVKFSGEIIFKMSKLGTTPSTGTNKNSTDVKEPADSIGEIIFIRFTIDITFAFTSFFNANF